MTFWQFVGWFYLFGLVEAICMMLGVAFACHILQDHCGVSNYFLDKFHSAIVAVQEKHDPEATDGKVIVLAALRVLFFPISLPFAFGRSIYMTAYDMLCDYGISTFAGSQYLIDYSKVRNRTEQLADEMEHEVYSDLSEDYTGTTDEDEEEPEIVEMPEAPQRQYVHVVVVSGLNDYDRHEDVIYAVFSTLGEAVECMQELNTKHRIDHPDFGGLAFREAFVRTYELDQDWSVEGKE